MSTRSGRPAQLALAHVLVLCAIVIYPVLCWSYTYQQVGVDSNLLIDDGRVVFAQSDGSLTVLSLESGEVLLRKKTRDYSGTLKRTDEGILVLNYGTITLLNPTNLSPAWETKSHYEPTIIAGLLVSCDGNGLVECCELKTGTIKWTFSLPGALEVAGESETVLVHRAAKFDETVAPTTVLLDLQTGRELWRKQPPPGVHWERAFYDGTNIYVLTGSYKTKRSDSQLERMAIWDHYGQEIRTIGLSDEQRKSLRIAGEVFDLENKTFYRRRVYAGRTSVPPEPHGRWIAMPGADDKGSTIYGYDLEGGYALFERKGGSDGEKRNRAGDGVEIELQTPGGRKVGHLPYLTGHGRISAISRARGRILVGTSLGHVECIDADSGLSRWLYVFPTIRHTMSFSSHGMPPTMSEAAAIYRREYGILPKSGFQLADGKQSSPRVIQDPNPTDPFRKLPIYLSVAWTAGMVPTILMILLQFKARVRDWSPVILGGVFASLTVLVLFCFFEMGRVSLGSSIALRLAILTGLIVGSLQAVTCHRRGHKTWAAVFIGLSLGITVVVFPAFLAL